MTNTLSKEELVSGSFHTQANLSQTLIAIINNHYQSVNFVESQPVPQLPHFVAEAVQQICHNLSGAVNGDIYHAPAWQAVAKYATNIVDIINTASQQTTQPTKGTNYD